LVAGKKRVPMPATGNTALVSALVIDVKLIVLPSLTRLYF
jgi:hypothetical protein